MNSVLLFLSLINYSIANTVDDEICNLWGSEIIEKKTCNDITNQFIDKSASCCWFKGINNEYEEYSKNGCQRITNFADYKNKKADLDKQFDSSELFCNSGLDEEQMCDKQAPTSFEPKVCNEVSEQFKDKTGYKCCWIKTTKAHDAYGCRRLENTEKGLKAIVNEGKINGARVDIQCEGWYWIRYSIVLLGIFIF